MNKTKTCRECGHSGPVDDFQDCFKKDGSRKYRSVCKPCWKKIRSEKRSAKTASITRLCRVCGKTELQYKKQVCVECQRNGRRLSNEAWRKANPDKLRVYEKTWRDGHPEELKAKKQRHRERHKDSITEKKRDYYAQNRERIRESQNKSRLNNIDGMREYYRARYRANKEEYKANARNRKARVKRASGRHTQAEIAALWLRQKKRCAVPGCINPIAASGKNKFHVDHVVALINGGTNDISNLQILCRTHNCSKQAKTPEEWAKYIGFLFI